MSTCTIRCQASQKQKCTCGCNGDNHGHQTLMFTPIPNVRQCAHCELPVHFDSEHGWVHPGGQTYVMECSDGNGNIGCGWVGEAPARVMTFKNDICPGCGVQGRLRDNHVAMPGKARR